MVVAVVVVVVVIVIDAIAVGPNAAIYAILHEFDSTILDAYIRSSADRERRTAAAIGNGGWRRRGYGGNGVGAEHRGRGCERWADWWRGRMRRR